MNNNLLENFYRILEKTTQAKVLKNECLAKHTTIRIGGPANALVIPQNTSALQKILSAAAEDNLPYFIIGNGSNLLVSDKGLKGIVIKIDGGLDKIEIKEETVKVGAGITIPQFLEVLTEKGLGGLEFAAGVPASVGGAVVNNLGAFEAKMSDFIRALTVLDERGKVKTLKPIDCDFGYHASNLREKKMIVTQVELRLKKDSPKNIAQKINEFTKKRIISQPLSQPSAGCVFKNPVGSFAGKLIDQAGLKGTRSGGALISEKHANFIVNIEKAKSTDVARLIKQVQFTVKEKFNLYLEPEIEYVSSPE